MKKYLLVLLLSTLTASGAFAQKRVLLQIEHRLGADTCTTYNVGSNSLGNDFKLYRLQYYMDQIMVVGSNGNVDTSDVVALVSGFEETIIDLGNLNVDTLSALRFGIGVNSNLNHLDPTQYSPQHPLAPKSPSMHWGWSSGYRFICVEGNGGSNFNQNFQFHGLGDANFALLTLPTSGEMVGSDTLTITITADYQELFRDMNISTGPVVHGETGMAAQVLHNINNYVFTSSEGNQAMELGENKISANISPNPSNGYFLIEVEQEVSYTLMDLNGRLIQKGTFTPGKHELSSLCQGMYLLRLQSNTALKTEKLYVR
jgi:hypothetical protein